MKKIVCSMFVVFGFATQAFAEPTTEICGEKVASKDVSTGSIAKGDDIVQFIQDLALEGYDAKVCSVGKSTVIIAKKPGKIFATIIK